jgi:hypothetical protein
MLLDRLNQSSDELEQMKAAFERQASLYDNEIKGLNDKLQRVTHQFDSAAATMRHVSFPLTLDRIVLLRVQISLVVACADVARAGVSIPCSTTNTTSDSC